MKTSAIFGLCGILALAGVPALSATAQDDSAVQPQGAALATVYDAATGEALPGMAIRVEAISIKSDDSSLTFMSDKAGHALLAPLNKGQYRAYLVWHNTVASDIVDFKINAGGMTEVVLYFNLDGDPD